MVTWVRTTAPTFPDQGGPHARYTILRPAVARPVRSRLLATNLPTLPRVARGGDPDHRPPHRLQPAPHRLGVGPRPSLQLSPRPLETALVRAPLGSPPGEVHPRPLRRRRTRLPGRRRYRRRAPRRPGPRQGLPSRSRPLDPRVQRLSLGAQMGRLDDPGPVPLRHAPLGAAGPGGALSLRREGPG